MPHAVVALPDLGLERFTSATGTFLFSNVPAGVVRVQVRRLGYSPREVTVTLRGGDTTETLEIELDRVAIPLTAIRVRALPQCEHPGPPDEHSDSTLATLFSQVALNARQYRLLAERYPFTYVMVSARAFGDSVRLFSDGNQDTVRIAGLHDWRYRPGRIATPQYSRRRLRSFFVHVLTLVDLADSTFVNNHCFHDGGLMSTDDLTAYRIDFVAASRIKAPDFSGEIYLDTATYQVRRTVFRVDPVLPIRGLTAMSVTTDFKEVLPGIPVIANVLSAEEFDTSVRGVRFARSHEVQWLIDFKFASRKPGDPVP